MGRTAAAGSVAAMSTQVDIELAWVGALGLCLQLAGCSLINAARDAPADASAPDQGSPPSSDAGHRAADATPVPDTGAAQCTPRDCAAAGAECGAPSDGCFGFLDCGGCRWPGWCGGGGSAYRCGRPSACINAGVACGYVDDGGSLVRCGACEAGEICDVPRPGVCGRPAACVAVGRGCGPLVEGGEALWCGDCPLGEVCNADGDCAPVQRGLCFEPSSQPLDSTLDRSVEIHGAAFAEQGRLWLYGSTDYFAIHEGDPACSRLMRMPMLDMVTSSSVAIEPVATSTFVQQPGACTRGGCRGWVSLPRLRRDGLEMLFDTSYPCAVWEDVEIYLAHRTSAGAPWRPPRFVPVSTLGDEPWDPVGNPVLLADNRTLVYSDGNDSATFKYARRRSTTPGDVSFQARGPAPLSDPAADGSDPTALIPRSLSCDGEHLIYARRFFGGQPNEARIVEILSTDPLLFGSPRVYGDGLRPADVVVESPDCSVVYHWGARQAPSYRRIIRCP